MLVLLWGQNSWAQSSETRPLGAFRGVKSGEGIDVYLKKGEKENARVEVSGARLDEVVTEVVGSTLRIEMRGGNYRNSSIKVYVTYVLLEKISASSASGVFSDGPIKAPHLEINASSAATIELNLVVDHVSVDVSSAAEVMLEGTAKSLQADASSAGAVDAYDLVVDDVNGAASSAGSIKTTANRQINAEASSGGSIRYRGNPTKTNTSASSGGSVKKSM